MIAFSGCVCDEAVARTTASHRHRFLGTETICAWSAPHFAVRSLQKRAKTARRTYRNGANVPRALPERSDDRTVEHREATHKFVALDIATLQVTISALTKPVTTVHDATVVDHVQVTSVHLKLQFVVC